MEYHQITLNEWMDMKDQLRRELNNVRQSYVRVGYILRKMDESKAYEAGGYKSVAEFAEKEHGLKPSTTSRWMSINREYSLGGYSETLDPKYIDMNASQLTEMLSLPMEDRELITPDTSREDIRELKRFNKEESRAEAAAVVSPIQEAFIEFLQKNPQEAAAVKALIQNGTTDAGHLSEAAAPGGTKMFRSGTKFITFTLGAPDIKVKVFGEGISSVSWSEFAGAAAVWMQSEATEEEDPAEQDIEGGTEDEEITGEQHAEAERQREDEENEVYSYGEAEEDADEGPEEEPEPDLNTPIVEDVDMSEEIAPAQLSQNSAEILEKNEVPEPEEIIVDEAGQPAPIDDEERERAQEEVRKAKEAAKEAEEETRREKVRQEREKAARLLALVEKEFDAEHWPEAEEEAEKLLKSLAYLRGHDTETAAKRVRQMFANY
jgi:hypothetical protein